MKIGDKYNKTFICNDEDGSELDRFELSGDIVYVDDDLFIVLADHNTNMEIVSLGMSYDNISMMYDIQLPYAYELNKFSVFIPLDTDIEWFLDLR